MQRNGKGRRQAMKSKLALGTMLAVGLIAPAALPCGAPFGNGINVDPKQDIVVVHKNGTETYVFQPRFCGSAQQFGLILPVPAKLSAQPALAKAEVFTNLVELSKPQIVTTTECARPGAGGSSGGWGGATGTGGSNTVVVSSGTVGFMDYAQLDTTSLDALTTWLTSNGYPYDAQATSAFDYYVKKGWYFLTFKVDQGAFTGTTTCKDLGPVKFSFPTSIPVVPTRMATARSKDTSGALSYASNFSWSVFGITEGSQQIGFADGASSTRVRNFSGLLDSTLVTGLDGLAAAGDRATKMTITFAYGSTDPDIALGLVAGQDYRETTYQVSYILCDGGTDTVAPADAAADLPPPRDAPADLQMVKDASTPVDMGTVVQKDAMVVTTPDVASPPILADAANTPDLAVVLPPESSGKSDAGIPAVTPDAAAVVAIADAAVTVTKRDAGTSPPVDQPPKNQSSGCSMSAFSGAGGALPTLVLAALAFALRRRRR
jgi:hypothetical protein